MQIVIPLAVVLLLICVLALDGVCSTFRVGAFVVCVVFCFLCCWRWSSRV